MTFHKTLAINFVILVAVSFTQSACSAQDANESASEARWWKGNLHTHSFWSDGNDFPEMIARWYYERDYNFLALTDHNILSQGEKWLKLETIMNRGGDDVMKKYVAAFGKDWIETRQNKDNETEVRLKTLDEFRSKFETPSKFLMVQGEEISDSVDGLPVHMNASNLKELLPPVGGSTVRESIQNNLRAAQQQQEKIGREILVHLNHPNFGWAITAEDLAAVTEERFMEVYNAHPGVNHNGNDQRASVERIWDIANTLRIDKFNAPPLYGMGTDDSHNYHGRPGSQPGRSWVMVRSQSLDAESLIQAMNQGDFYSSSGVTLSDVQFDAETKTLTIDIDAEEGLTYSTEFIGTKAGYDDSSEPRTDAEGNKIRTTRKYSDSIGEVLAKEDGTQVSYQFQGDELYVRAVVISSRKHPNPSLDDQYEKAWTNPVGWEK